MISRRNVIACSFAGLLTQAHEAAADVNVDGQPTIEKLYELIKGLSDALRDVRMSSPPIGSVQAFPGEWPPYRHDGERTTELELGWLLCDGRSLDSVEKALLEDWKKQPENAGKSPPETAFLRDLRAALTRLVDEKPTPQTVVPDYRGLFLRGNDDGRGFDPNRQLGSEQEWATARPSNPANKFRTSIGDPKSTGDGSHSHAHPPEDPDNGNTSFNLILRSHGRGTPNFRFLDDMMPGPWREPDVRHAAPLTEGYHSHEINEGGDTETRPRNASIKWIIKFR